MDGGLEGLSVGLCSQDLLGWQWNAGCFADGPGLLNGEEVLPEILVAQAVENSTTGLILFEDFRVYFTEIFDEAVQRLVYGDLNQGIAIGDPVLGKIKNGFYRFSLNFPVRNLLEEQFVFFLAGGIECVQCLEILEKPLYVLQAKGLFCPCRSGGSSECVIGSEPRTRSSIGV